MDLIDALTSLYMRYTLDAESVQTLDLVAEYVPYLFRIPA